MKKLLTIVLTVTLNFALVPVTVSAQGDTSGLRQQQRPAPRRVSPEQQRALDELSPRLTKVKLDRNAVPAWLMGDLGPAQGKPQAAAVAAARRLAPVLRGTADDDFTASQRELADQLGQVHVRLQQRYRGLRVVGGELIVHMQDGRTIGINGRFVPDLSVDVSSALAAEAAIAAAGRALTSGEVKEHGAAELVIHVDENDVARLAWSQMVSYVDQGGMWQLDEVFADAGSGELLDRHPQVMTDKHRQIYDGLDQGLTGWNLYILPGTLLFEEGGSSPDDVAMAAYDNTGLTYDFYKEVFGRDSWDNAGSTMISTVHLRFGASPNNAAWLSYVTSSQHNQIAFGDGDGVTFSPFAQSLDVVAHELTHGVTQSTARLTYRGESGALNEATSDILGVSAEAYIEGEVPDWRIAEDVYTPGYDEDALRYMYSPTKDQGQSPSGYTSVDYYPERLFPNCTFSSPDNCGVHYNSGIANLAFYLMVNGGTHPRGKTSVVVPAIGFERAVQIWYRALTVYMTSGTNFLDARDTTMHAAADLYGGVASMTDNAVEKAWRAVGVENKGLNILRNPGFESTSFSVWNNNSMGWVSDNVKFDDATAWPVAPLPRTGDRVALFGDGSWPAAETLYQDVTIDPTATSARLSFWLQIVTDETTTSSVIDTLKIQLRDPKNNLLTTLATYSNLGPNANNGLYVKKSFDVTAYRGQTVRVYFEGLKDLSNKTFFLIDDTALIIE